MTADIRRITDTFGVEALGVDARREPTPELAAALRTALEGGRVMVIRDQTTLDPDSYVRFISMVFGELEPFFLSSFNHPANPRVYVLSNVYENGRPIGRDGAGTHWHTDSTFVPEPSYFTILHGHVVPTGDGDTIFADTTAAYEALPAATRARIDDLQVIHRYQKREHLYTADTTGPGTDPAHRARVEALRERRRKEEEARAASPTAKASNTMPDVRHPLALRHPRTGRRGLFLNEGMMVGIDGMPEAEALDLLAEMTAFATRPEFRYRHQWRQGDIAIWDNWATAHCATYTDPERARVMWRLSVKGGPTIPGRTAEAAPAVAY